MDTPADDPTGDMTDVEIHQFGNEMKGMINKMAEIYEEKANADEKKEMPTFNGYLHLKDVKYLVPTHVPLDRSPFPYWRVPLSEVAGWTLGLWNENTDNE
jgi:hypothetical protein